jgi:gluconate kinase
VSKGFAYDLEDDKIREYMKLSDEDKLRWLEEINEFTQAVLGEKEKRFREILRAGERDLRE